MFSNQCGTEFSIYTHKFPTPFFFFHLSLSCATNSGPDSHNYTACEPCIDVKLMSTYNSIGMKCYQKCINVNDHFLLYYFFAFLHLSCVLFINVPLILLYYHNTYSSAGTAIIIYYCYCNNNAAHFILSLILPVQ